MRADDLAPLTAEILYVYPTALKAEGVLRQQARTAGCLLGHRVTTFPQLTDALARDFGSAPRVLEPELAAVVLARALEGPGVPQSLRGPYPGIVRELLKVIGELKAAYLTPDEVAEIAAALPAGAAGARLGELAGVYAGYEARLARLGAVDRHGRDWRVCDGLAAAEASGAPPRTLAGVQRIVFAEIYDFSVLQFLIATSLIRLVGDAELIAFAHPANVDATRFLDRTWNRFVGDPGIADQVLPAFVVRGGRQGSLAAALGGVFTTERPLPAPGDGSIRVVAAPNRYREVEAAVRDVRRRLERGERPERIALLARDLTVYGDLIEDVCRRYRVPVYFRKGKPLLASGLVKACVNVVRCVADGFPRARLEAVLDSDYLAAGHPGLVRALRRSAYVAEAARPLAECLAHDAKSGPHGARLLALTATLRGLDGPRTVDAHVRALRRTLRQLRFRAVRSHDVGAVVVRRDARAWERFEEALGALAGIAGALGIGRVPLAEFVRLLLASLEPLEIEDRVERVGSVRALSVLDARGLDFDVVHLLGLDDGTFPAPRSESPLLPDALKREVNRLAVPVLRRKLGARAGGLPAAGLLRTAREASLEDPFLFFLALSMAERQLVLSWPVVDERGNPTVRSPFVDEVAACVEGELPEDRLSPTALVPAASECCEPAELIARVALDRWARQRAAPPDRLAGALRAAMAEGAVRIAAIDRRALIEERRSRYFLTPPADDPCKEALADVYVGRVHADAALAARLASMPWTPTVLERLGVCGFKFFADRVLRLGEQTEPDLEVEKREQGTLFHRILEDFFRAHPRLPAELEAARALARRFLIEVRSTALRVIPAKDPHFLALTWARIETALDELIVLEHEEQRELAAQGIEVERSLEERLVFALADPAGGPALQLEGRPDRIEVHRRGAETVRVRVLDYKTTSDSSGYRARLDPAKDLGRTSFQIPIYLLGTVAKGVAGLSAETAFEGGFLLLLARARAKVQTASIAGDLLGTGATTPAGVPTLAQRVRDLVAAAEAGRFDVNPSPCDPYCAYRSVCRYQPPPLEDDDDHG